MPLSHVSSLLTTVNIVKKFPMLLKWLIIKYDEVFLLLFLQLFVPFMLNPLVSRTKILHKGDHLTY